MNKLYKVVDLFWAEIADYVAHIEGFSESDDFPDKDLAAAIASKVFLIFIIYIYNFIHMFLSY